jgi:hypothetical protein
VTFWNEPRNIVMPSVLERLEALNEGATKGPWRWDVETLRGKSNNAIFYPVAHKNSRTPVELINCEEDAALIAAARNALPDLLAAIRAAERAVIVWYDPKRTAAENDELRQRALDFNAALAPLLREAEE